MYKRISHLIQEEHFDHPMVLPKEMFSATPTGKTTISSYVLTEPAVQFRMDSRTLWSKYVWCMLNYAMSLFYNGEALDILEQKVTVRANDIGASVADFYGAENTKQFSTHLIDFAKAGLEVARDVKSGRSIDSDQAAMLAHGNAIAIMLNKWNPSNWPTEIVKDYFDNLVKFWVEAIRAKDTKNRDAIQSATDHIDQLMITGLTNDKGTLQGFADVFSKGVVSQHADKFMV